MKLRRYPAPAKATVFTVALLFLSAAFSVSKAQIPPEPTASLRFALADKHGFPLPKSRSKFDCQDKVYAVTQASHFAKGKHAIEFRWIDPYGKTLERTRYDFFVDKKPTTKLWAWLELSRGKGAGVVKWLDPTAGLENFIGEWELELILNGKTYNQGTFEVNC